MLQILTLALCIVFLSSAANAAIFSTLDEGFHNDIDESVISAGEF